MSTQTLEFDTMPHTPPPQPITNVPPVEAMADDTVCLKLWFTTLGTSRKADPGEVDIEANTEVFNISKRILQCKELKAIKQADSAFKRDLERYCVQGLDIGVRIVKHGRLEGIVGDTNAKELRKDDTFRAEVVSHLASVESNLSAMIEHRPARKFHFAAE